MRNLAGTTAVFCLALCLLLTGCSSGGNNSGGGNNAGGGSATNTSGTTATTPSVTAIAPAAVGAGAGPSTLTVSGTGFTSATTVQVGGVNATTTFVSANQVTAVVPATQLTTGVLLPVTAANGALASNAVTLEVDNPSPTLSQFAPSFIPLGSGVVTITATGSAFTSSTVLQVNGSPRPTTVMSATQLTAVLTAADAANAGTLAVTAVAPSPGGGTSGPVGLPVNNPAPAIIQLIPASLVVGAPDTSVSVFGTGFLSSTTVNLGSTARATTYVSGTQVNVTVTAADLLASGNLSFVAVNPAPGGGSSAAASVSVNYGVPSITGFSPASLVPGTATPTVVTVSGTNFNASSYVTLFGLSRPTTVLSSTRLTFVATPADQATVATLRVSVVNPVPGGTSLGVTGSLPVAGPTATPSITQILPATFVVGSPSSTITVSGSGITNTSTVQWNGTTLAGNPIFLYQGSLVSAISVPVPGSLLASTGTAAITVTTPTATPAVSNALTATITNPPVPTLTGINPSSGPINVATSETLTGTGFTAASTVAVNGQTVPSTFVSPTSITATFTASSLAIPGNRTVTVTTPAPGGGTSAAQVFSAYISMPNNDLVFNSADGLLYASVPASAVGAIGNCVVGIDPATGSITRQIAVGTNPNKLALSTDGKQLFVGVDGASAVAQIDLAQAKVVNQFPLGGGPGLYNAPYTATYLAALPGLPNSVAVAITGQYGNGSSVTVFDSGVARTGGSAKVGSGPLSFGTSASTLYLGSSNVSALTVSAAGITTATQLASTSGNLTTLQYDNGALYLSNGQVIDASSGALKGTFYSATTTQASGPVVSDSTLGRAFVAVAPFSSTAAVYVFDENSFNLIGSIPVSGLGTQGYPTNFRKIVRWGQNGLALAASPSAFTSKNQIYILQSALIKDVSSAPSDVAVTLAEPAVATTGTAVTYVATVTNAGPSAAASVALTVGVDPNLIINSVTASKGSCTNGTSIVCDLGSLPSGGSTVVTVNATPTTAGTLQGTASLSTASYDPVTINNQSSASTTVTGSLYGTQPSVSAVSPALVQAGSAAFTLTVTGNGFNAGSTVNVGGAAVTTTYVSATKLTASIPATAIANYGWAPVTVTNPAPGGGQSAVTPLTIYALVNVPANAMLFDTYDEFIYATIPGSATGITGNSVVQVNPFTGSVGTPVPVGSQPNVLAETSDGNYLYIGLSGASSLAQYNLLTQSLTATIPIRYQSANTPALALATMPGSDTTLAIDFSAFAIQFGIFDVNGSTGSFRSNISGIYSGNHPVFASPTQLYAYDSQTSGFEFYRYGISSSGLSLMDGTTLNGLGGYNGGIQLAAGLVYGQGGGIINPSTTPPSQLQTLPLIDFYGSGSTGRSDGVVADPSLGKSFLVLENLAGTSAYGLVRYDLTSYLPEAILQLPSSISGVQASSSMQRFGQDGIALLSTNSFGVTPAVTTLLLLRGPFIAPQELSTSTAASLTSNPAVIAHGSGNLMLTLTGSNFLPGVAVTWNGSYRTTTVTDTTHVTIAVPASDVSAAGTVSLQATNPGAPASASVTLIIN